MTAPPDRPDSIGSRLEVVAGRIEAAARRARRDPAAVTLIGVTKTVPADRIAEAVAAGLSHVGENRVQEAAGKIEALAGPCPGIAWHLIGHLQSNKARKAAALFEWIHSVDSQDLVLRLDRAAPPDRPPVEILLQVDLGQEPTKHGVDTGVLKDLADVVSGCGRLRLRGLMTLPPLFEDPERVRPFFRRLRGIRDDLAARGLDLPHLSMGMSGDFEVAAEEGATMVRVARAIFGDRPVTPPG